MNLGMKKAKKNIMNQKKLYFFLIGLIIVGLITGILFWFAISNEDKLLVTNDLTNFFSALKKEITLIIGLLSLILL